MEPEKIAFGRKLDDPRWLEVAESVLNRDERFCQCCANIADLEVHFFAYPSDDPWSVPLHELTTLCRRCHAIEHATRSAIERLLLSSFETAKFLSADLVALLPHVICTFQSRHDRISDDRMRRIGNKTKAISSDPQIANYTAGALKVADRIHARMTYDQEEFDMSDEFFDLRSQFLGMDKERRTLAEALIAKIGSIEPPDLPKLSALLHNNNLTSRIAIDQPRLAES